MEKNKAKPNKTESKKTEKNIEKQNHFYKKKSVVITAIVLLLIAGIGIGMAVYLNDYYPADTTMIQALEIPENYTVTSPRKDITAYIPKNMNLEQSTRESMLGEQSGSESGSSENATAGLIFYPGGKVEHKAYESLMKLCASKGILCVLVEMPFRLAVFSMNAADGVQELFPEVERWYMSGHSLGGSMAASYLEKNTKDYEGLILLASYSTADLSKEDLKVLSIYGSEDKVLNQENYTDYKKNLPQDFEEYEISGGCHAYFGVYGAQEGDGEPKISVGEQLEMTVNEIVSFVGVNED